MSPTGQFEAFFIRTSSDFEQEGVAYSSLFKNVSLKYMCVQGLPFQRPSTKVWEKLASDAETCQRKFNEAFLQLREGEKEDADAIAEEALALLKTRRVLKRLREG